MTVSDTNRGVLRRDAIHLVLGAGLVLLTGCAGSDDSGPGREAGDPAPLVISASSSGPTTHRLYTFIEHDPGAIGSPDYDGYLAIREGYDYVSFPVIRSPTLTNQPSGHSLRDPSVVRDPTTGTYWMLASAHFINDGPGAAECDLYMSQPGDGVNFVHVCSIPAGVTGTTGMWAPDFLPPNATAPLEFVVTLRVPGPNGGTIGQPHLYRSTSMTNGSWELVGPLTGSGIPASLLDWNMTSINGQWVACTVDYSGAPREQLLILTAPDRMGPWSQSVAAPLFGESQVEAPQLFQPGNGAVGLYYDRFTGAGMQYRETRDLFRTYTGAAQVVTPNFVNRAGQTVYAAARHGTVLRI